MCSRFARSPSRPGCYSAAPMSPVDLTTFFGCVIAGALGALISVVTRMSADKFHVRHEVGRGYVQRVAAFRPFIGSVFGVLVYFALAGDVITGITVPADIPGNEEKRFAFFLVFAFVAGFSERMVKEVLRSTGGEDERKPGAGGGYVAGSEGRRRNRRSSRTRRVTPSASRRSSTSCASRRPQPARSRKRASAIRARGLALLDDERSARARRPRLRSRSRRRAARACPPARGSARARRPRP